MKKRFSAILLIFFLLPYFPKAQAPTQKDLIYSYKNPERDGTGKVYMGREIAAIQGFEGAEWLERINREEEEHSDEAIRHFPLKGNSWVADFGAGTGFYSFKISPLVPKGRVFSVEIEQKYIDYLNKKIKTTGMSNISPIKSTEKSSNLPEGKLDLIFMVDVYHELSFPQEILNSLKNALKPGGRILLLEYKAEDPNVPIKELHKMSLAQVDKELKANGFIRERTEDFLPWQHFILYRKPY